MATFIVSTTIDETDGNTTPGNLSLREALGLANADPGADTILFDPGLSGGTIHLVQGALPVATDMEIDGDIDGDGFRDITLSADSAQGANDAADRVIDIVPATPGAVLDVTLRGLEIRDGAGVDGAGIFIDNDATVLIESARLTDNDGFGAGGAIKTDRDVTLEIVDSQILNNTSNTRGGAAYFDNDNAVTIRNSLFAQNVSGFNGGAIYTDDGVSLSIYGSRFDRNSADAGGGGIYLDDDGVLLLDGAAFTANTAGGRGGGLYLENYTAATIRNSLISGNESQNSLGGGGIYSNGRAEIEIVRSTISANTAPIGGGIASDPGDVLIITDSVITGNRATGTGQSDGGGGIFANATSTVSSTLTITNSTISGNTTGGDGGGLRLGQHVTARIDGATVSGNSATTQIIGSTSWGGGIYNAGTLTVTGSSIVDNVATFGGGIRNEFGGGRLTLTDSTIARNSATDDGGGLSSSAPAFLSGVAILDNTAADIGGGINAGGLTAINVTIAGNSARLGAGGQTGGDVTLVQATVTGNRALDAVGGLRISGETTLANSIVAGNAAGSLPSDLGSFFAGSDDLTLEGVNVLGSPPVNLLADTGGDVVLGDGNALTPGDVFDALDPLTGGGAVADNGGRVATAKILRAASNPALDGGDEAVAIAIREGLGDFDGDGLSGEVLALSEALIGLDLNGDGDLDDAFATVGDLAFDARGPGFARGVNVPQIPGVVDIGAFEAPGSQLALPSGTLEVIEGDAGAAVARFAVTRTGDLSAPVTFDYLVTLPGPDAAQPDDFASPLNGSVAFAPGETEKVIEVEIAGDVDAEGDELFGVTLFNIDGLVTVSPAVALGRILDDDAEGTAGQNAPPAAVPDFAATPVDTEITLDLLANDSDPDNDPLTLLAVDFGQGGPAEIVGNQLRYRPRDGFEGMEELRYTVSDGRGGTDAGLVSIRVGDPAVAVPSGNLRGTAGDDALLVFGGATYLGGAGDDIYQISPGLRALETSVISDTANDVIKLAEGTLIAEALITPNAVSLTLGNGAVVQILNATAFAFELGANVTTADPGTVQDYASFASDTLGAAVPASGTVSAPGPVVIGDGVALASGPLDAPEADPGLDLLI